ncbi:mitochondrial genome maintenance MGM101-domain-containing protein [Gymnopilus junonius]|uniref:Mitochondrial genome maintenance protein MGM101 n=1 Tax=Gymnopilus junonius TaxID=109634 RepID=A0A9P5P3N7_GYMJU|nr:mitochondrial genome maintenance MGM101-domain-containing protein [Gymnopilus junonius]
MASLGFRRLIAASTRSAAASRIQFLVSLLREVFLNASRATVARFNSTATSAAPKSETPQAANNNNGATNGGQVDSEVPEATDGTTDWSKSYSGLSTSPFSKEISDVLMAPINPQDVEIKPDGLIYLPEIKYRRILNRAFGPGGWGLAPRSETNVGPKIVSREYALVCLGRLVSIARGEQEYFDPSGIATATEACKSNALMRCSKDLGIASELWDPRFIREFKEKYCVELFVEHVPTKKKKKLWRRKDQPKFAYPYQE